MPLVLEQLSFSVDSSQLDEARIKIAKLGDAVNSLNKPMQNMAVSSAKTAEAIARAELAAEKARQATAKLGEENTQAAPKVNSLEKLLTKLTNTYLDMGRGFSKGEASILNQARSLGALDDQLALVEAALKNIKELNKDPFDSSLGGVRSITQEFERLTQRANLAAQGIMLTTKQLGEYSRLAAEARSKTIGEGLSLSSPEGQARMNQLLQEAQTDYLKTAASVNQLTEEERQRLAVLKEQEKAQRLANSASIERAKLQDDLILREQKLAFVNKELAAGLTTASANALFKYEKDLRAVGTSTEEVIKRTTAFRTALLEKQSYSGFKKLAEDVNATRQEVNHLARAVSVQLGDVFVSLAGGMNPFMVAIQQGDQIRGALEQAAAAGQSTDKVMKGAFQSMANSFIMVGKIVKDFTVDGILFMGNAITSVTSDVLGITAAGNYFSAKMDAMGVSTEKYTTSLVAMNKVLKLAVGLFGTGLILELVAGASAMLQLSKEQTAVAQAVAKSGAVFGATTQEAVELSKSLGDIGVGSAKATEIMKEVVGAGNLTKESFKGVVQAAAEVEKYVGIKAADSIKQFSEVAKEPVKALLDFGIKTGYVTEEQVKMVKGLVDSNREIEAQALAVDILKSAYLEMASVAKEGMSDLDLVWIRIKETISGVWESFKQSKIVADTFRTAWEVIAVTVSEVWYVLVQTGKEIGGIAAQIAAVARGDFSGAFSIHKQMKEDAVAARKAQDDLVASILNRNKSESDGAEISAKTRRENSNTLSSYKKLLDEQKKSSKAAASEQNKLENSFESVMKRLANLSNAGVAAQEEYSKAQKAALDIFAMPEFQKFSTAQKIAIAQAIERAHAEEVAGAAAKKGLEDYEKALADFLKVRADAEESVRKSREELNSENQMYEFQNSLIGISSSERELLISLKKEDLKTEREIQDQLAKGININEQVIQDIRQIGEERKKLLTKTFEQKEFKEMQDVLSGAIADALFEGGKKGADSLKNYLKTTFRKYVIDVIINPIVGSLMGASGVQGASSSLLGNMGSSLLSNAVTGISGVASAFGTAFSNAALSTVQGWVGMSGTAAQMGTSLANAGYYAGSAAGTTASGIGASIGAYAPYALAAVVALDLLGFLNAWSDDPDAFLLQAQTGQNNPFVNQRTTAFGQIGFAQGTINVGGRAIRGETEDVSTEFQNSVLAIFQGLDAEIAKSLTQGQIKQVSKQLEGWWKTSWSFESNMIDEWIADRYEVILKALEPSFGSVKDYQKEGEKLTDTTIRLITNLTTVRNTFDSLGISADTVTAKFATNLTDMLGGISNFSSSMQFFYENFFSEEEKMQRATEGLTKAFAAMNLTVPETKDQFRALLEGALSSGNLGLSASLMALMQPFNDFIAANEELAQSVNETVDSIQQEINRLRGENLADSIVQGTALRAEFDIMSALARGGDITALAKLPEYSQAIEKNMTDFASSASDVIFARALLAQSLSDTMSSLGGNTTIVPTSVSNLAGSTSIATTGAADLTASVTSQGDLVSVLIAEIQGLRAEVRADVSANTKTAKILERANQDGETLSVTVVA